MLNGILFFVHRNVRVDETVGIVTATVSAATIIGWMTAPV